MYKFSSIPNRSNLCSPILLFPLMLDDLFAPTITQCQPSTLMSESTSVLTICLERIVPPLEILFSSPSLRSTSTSNPSIPQQQIPSLQCLLSNSRVVSTSHLLVTRRAWGIYSLCVSIVAVLTESAIELANLRDLAAASLDVVSNCSTTVRSQLTYHFVYMCCDWNVFDSR